jgi:hypothetical protein
MCANARQTPTLKQPNADNSWLSPREQQLVTSILRNAASINGGNEECSRLVRACVSRAIGELVLHTAFEEMGEEVLREIESSQTAGRGDSLFAPHFGPHPPKEAVGAQSLGPHFGPHPPKEAVDAQNPGPHFGPHPPKEVADAQNAGPHFGPHPPKEAVDAQNAGPHFGPHPPKEAVDAQNPGPHFGPHPPKEVADAQNLGPHFGPHPPKEAADAQNPGPHFGPHPPKGTSGTGNRVGLDRVEVLANPRPPVPAPPAPSPSPAPPPGQELPAKVPVNPHPGVQSARANVTTVEMKSPSPPSPAPPAPSPAPPQDPLNPRPPGISREVIAVAAPIYASLLAENHVLMEEFLAPSELKELTRFVLAHEADFAISEVVSPGVPGAGMIAHEYRRSRVLLDLGPFREMFLDRLQPLLPRVMEQIGVECFKPTRSEVQMTASNHGDFFREHSDTGQAEIATRALTFVYFFHPEPRTFRGGHLRMFDSRPFENGWRRAGASATIVPQQNQIVFFPSELVHEITPIECGSRAFADSRFTVNGWLHR